MPHTIEKARSGRASCRTCKESIAKDELRLGEEIPNQFSPGETAFLWHHLACACKKRPSVARLALASTELEIPDREDLLAIIAQSAKTEKPTTLPYAEHAPTSRASCMACAEKIEKGELRLAVEKEGDSGSFMRNAPGYLHPACAKSHLGDACEELLAQIKTNTLNLPDDEMSGLERSILDAAGEAAR